MPLWRIARTLQDCGEFGPRDYAGTQGHEVFGDYLTVDDLETKLLHGL